jgi:hypothetical protein
MNKFLIGIAIGVATSFTYNKLNAQCWTTGGSLLNSGSPICSATQSVIPAFSIGLGAGFLTGGISGAFGAAVGEVAMTLIGLKGIS